jgi:hypothetical protein
MEITLTHALKEWAVAVDALMQGDTILLLRKGGIREAAGKFTVAHSHVWLYPTYEHQQSHLLKPEYAAQVNSVPSGWHPEQVTIAAHAEITHLFQISEPDTVAALRSFHIWNEQFVSDRLRWQPRQPLYVLLLRTYRLDSPQTVPFDPAYGGCKSWIDLKAPLSTDGAIPALSDQAYSQQVSQIQQLIGRLEPQAIAASEAVQLS